MKLLVITHVCATPANQDLFVRVERITGWSLTLVLPRRWRTEYGEREAAALPGLRAKLRPLPIILNGNIPLHFYRASLARVLGRERPDAIYVQHDPHGLATMQAFAANRRTVRAPIGFKNDQSIPKRYPWPIRLGERFVYRNAAFALVPARAAGEALRAKGYRGPLRVTPYTIDPSLYRPGNGDRTRVGALIVGYVGRLVPEKGVDTLLEALALAPAEVRALIVGSGPAESRLRTLAAKLGIDRRIEWRGYVEHLEAAAVYREMDLLVVPSKTTEGWTEQFGRVVIEALACEVPVCSSDSGEPPRLVEATGGGYTFPENDPKALAARLRWATANRQELRRRAAAGRRRVLEDFSSDAVAESFVDVVRRYALDGTRDPGHGGD